MGQNIWVNKILWSENFIVWWLSQQSQFMTLKLYACVLSSGKVHVDSKYVPCGKKEIVWSGIELERKIMSSIPDQAISFFHMKVEVKNKQLITF